MVKKKKESKVLPQKQKSRAQYQCLPELSELIRQANLVPVGVITPDFEWERVRELQRLRKETGDPSPEFSSFEFLTNLISHLPTEFLGHIKEVAYNSAFPLGEGLGYERSYKQALVKTYIEYCSMRDSMYWLVRRIEEEHKRMRDTEKSRQLKKGSITFEHFHLLNWDSNPISIKTVLKRDDDGNLYITGLAALIGKFDDSRLRRCVIESCQKIFWAKREESETCSARCFGILRTRRYRKLTDEEKAERKAQREANRERNKKLKTIKEKKNGTL
ncbi:MAG TPA: hypothetical protein VNI84_12465 [Pyrinomonadaceae bacterium]|nr:hypothetical protein [Pyrinomonadaceae bacterium]